MRVRFTFKHMESSKGLMEVAEAKFENLMRRFRLLPQRVHVIVDTDGPLKKMHATVVTSNGRDVEADVRGENAYSMVDALIQKIDGQLRKNKERLKFYKLKSESRSRKSRKEGKQLKFTNLGGFWAQAPIDATEILKLSAESRGPLTPSRAS